jgi:hypothetical protein
VRLDLVLLEDRAAVRSPAADLGCQRRSKTGRRSLAIDWPRAFEPRSVPASADSDACGVRERHKCSIAVSHSVYEDLY